MGEATLLIAVGTRAVCQADCSGIGYKKVESVINLNADLDDLHHYNHTLVLPGDIGASIESLLNALGTSTLNSDKREWLARCKEQKHAWLAQLARICDVEPLFDNAWQQSVLTQPTAIKIVADFAKTHDAMKLFDAGDVQAHGFQLVEDDSPFATITESGASYMGFAVSAALASALADNSRYPIAFSGDGSFMMNPQVLIDSVAHGLRGMIVIFDNRRMAAISALQRAQYGADFATSDTVAVDYLTLANAVHGVRAWFGGTTVAALQQALTEAYAYDGLSVVHVPTYWGEDPRGSIPAYGSWNVGNWCEDVQRRYHAQDL